VTPASSRLAWEVVEHRGSAAELHARPLLTGRRLVEVLTWRRTALVLGSTQSLREADRAAADRIGADLVRRRSGGGAVLLHPHHDLWIDVTVPRGDPLWQDDVAVSFHWLGQAWAAALRGLGLDASVHLAPSLEGPWSRKVCFAGIGAGEVTIGAPGDRPRKVVGLSQRRVRDAARFQCLVPGSWDPAELLGLLALADKERASGLTELADVATGTGHPPADVAQALLTQLER
jgi:lipoate-protein ligase A